MIQSRSVALFRAVISLAFASIVTGPVDSSTPRIEVNPTLRIGLVRLFGRAERILVSAPEGSELTSSTRSVLAKGAAVWEMKVNGTGGISVSSDGKEIASESALRIAPPSADAPVSLSLTEFGKPVPAESGTPPASRGRRSRRAVRPTAQTGYPYRGTIEISAIPASSRLRIVNEIPLESYLRGVVAAEMPDTAAPEALKAQAIASRTYALMDRSRFRAQGYDLNDTTTSQVYGGVRAERSTSDAAIRDTEGTVVTRNGAMVFADFYDDCGGATAPGSTPDDYPPSVSDRPTDGGADFCARGTYHAWSLTLSREDLAKAIPPSIVRRVGAVKSLEVSEMDESGRVRKVAIIGEDGRRVEMKGWEFRGALGTDRLKSTLFTLTTAPDGALRFDGRGWGHGHGMCQMGAMGLAAAPYRRICAQILEHYFPGSKLASLAELARAEAGKARGHGTR